MGLSCAWLAVKGGNKDDILKKLNLVETGEDVEPGSRNPGTPMCYFEWPSGWFILVSDDYGWVDQDLVLDFSQSGLTLGYSILENVEAGFTTALAAEKGVILWRVAHNGDTAKIEVSGNPPEAFIDIRDRITREQEEKDDANYLLDIPTELAKAVTGYRLDDEDIPFKGLKFGQTSRAVSQAPTTAKGILSALFGFNRKLPPKETEL